MNPERKNNIESPQALLQERPTENPLKDLDLSTLGLGITKHYDNIIKMIDQYDTNIFVIATGQGKTTGLPPMLLKRYPDANIVITQPRNAPMDKIASHAAKLVGDKVGGLVGVRYGGFDSHSDERTKIMYEMEQSLLNEYTKDHLLTKYNIAILDEIHEPGARTKYLAPLLLMAQRERKLKGMKPLKIIFTSATLDAENLQEKLGRETTGKLVIEGDPPFNIEKEYTTVKYKPEEMPKAAALQAKSIITNPAENNGDILIFLAGVPEINKTIRELESLGINEEEFEFLKLHSGTKPEEKDAISKKAGNKRRIILSTNAGETGVTFSKELFHVIDTGLIKENKIDPVTGMQYLAIDEHSWSGSIQRDGRVGRLGPGKAWHLYTRENFDKRLREKKYTESEILRTNISPDILELLNAGITDIRRFPFLETPKQSQIDHALHSLKRLGAINEQEELTDLGHEMAKGHKDLHLERMMIEGKRLNITPITKVLSELIESESAVVRDSKKAVSLKKSGSDLLTLLNIYNEFLKQPDKKLWAEKFGVDAGTLDRIARENNGFGGKVIDIDKEHDLIGRSIAAGFKDQIIEMKNDGLYKLIAHPTSGVIKIDSYSQVHNRGSKYLSIVGIKKGKDGRILTHLGHNIKKEWIEDILQKKQEPLITQRELETQTAANAVPIKSIGKKSEIPLQTSPTDHSPQPALQQPKLENKSFTQRIKTAINRFINYIKNLFRNPKQPPIQHGSII